ncbi:uncharacterized protein BCR38DRAFT_482495 [Pseudomassariella vexata]|uniref:Uncharacterized protein n=1 Tax=Pseudomassariella vexata TaxID=1141098 RepID=A0A1Y2EBR5_9PEZI|nr:uncharacterized protein BCR38DRAFT_482495 [Pseudomassariella vexata]ORY69019.1 hypothetical protein BCR38DRAFT_482495 [Pseudomassariella vexata]
MATILDAMMDDLGDGRMEDLARDNRRDRHFDPILKSTTKSVASNGGPKTENLGAQMWQNAVAENLFHDDDALGVQGLDSIADGNLHRLRREQSGPARGGFGAGSSRGGFHGSGSLPGFGRGRGELRHQIDRMLKNTVYDPANPNAGRGRAPRLCPNSERSNEPSFGVTSLGGLPPPGAMVKRWKPGRGVSNNAAGHSTPTGVGRGPPFPLPARPTTPRLSSIGRGTPGLQKSRHAPPTTNPVRTAPTSRRETSMASTTSMLSQKRQNGAFSVRQAAVTEPGRAAVVSPRLREPSEAPTVSLSDLQCPSTPAPITPPISTATGQNTNDLPQRQSSPAASSSSEIDKVAQKLSALSHSRTSSLAPEFAVTNQVAVEFPHDLRPTSCIPQRAPASREVPVKSPAASTVPTTASSPRLCIAATIASTSMERQQSTDAGAILQKPQVLSAAPTQITATQGGCTAPSISPSIHMSTEARSSCNQSKENPTKASTPVKAESPAGASPVTESANAAQQLRIHYESDVGMARMTADGPDWPIFHLSLYDLPGKDVVIMRLRRDEMIMQEDVRSIIQPMWLQGSCLAFRRSDGPDTCNMRISNLQFDSISAVNRFKNEVLRQQERLKESKEPLFQAVSSSPTAAKSVPLPLPQTSSTAPVYSANKKAKSPVEVPPASITLSLEDKTRVAAAGSIASEVVENEAIVPGVTSAEPAAPKSNKYQATETSKESPDQDLLVETGEPSTSTSETISVMFTPAPQAVNLSQSAQGGGAIFNHARTKLAYSPDNLISLGASDSDTEPEILVPSRSQYADDLWDFDNSVTPVSEATPKEDPVTITNAVGNATKPDDLIQLEDEADNIKPTDAVRATPTSASRVLDLDVIGSVPVGIDLSQSSMIILSKLSPEDYALMLIAVKNLMAIFKGAVVPVNTNRDRAQREVLLQISAYHFLRDDAFKILSDEDQESIVAVVYANLCQLWTHGNVSYTCEQLFRLRKYTGPRPKEMDELAELVSLARQINGPALPELKPALTPTLNPRISKEADQKATFWSASKGGWVNGSPITPSSDSMQGSPPKISEKKPPLSEEVKMISDSAGHVSVGSPVSRQLKRELPMLILQKRDAEKEPTSAPSEKKYQNRATFETTEETEDVIKTEGPTFILEDHTNPIASHLQGICHSLGDKGLQGSRHA